MSLVYDLDHFAQFIHRVSDPIAALHTSTTTLQGLHTFAMHTSPQVLGLPLDPPGAQEAPGHHLLGAGEEGGVREGLEEETEVEEEAAVEEVLEAVIKQEREATPRIATIQRRRSLARGEAGLQVGAGLCPGPLTLPQVRYQAEAAHRLEDIQGAGRPRRVSSGAVGALKLLC